MDDVKSSTSNAVWWIKKPKKRHTQRWGTKLCQDMADLFRHISLHGYSKLFDRILLPYEKLIWLCVHVVVLVFMYIALTYTWDQYALQYFSINLHDPLYPIEKVPFPAVSICSNNRISRRAAEQYARELSKLDPKNKSVEFFMERISYFKSFFYKYDRLDDLAAFREFQQFLDVHSTRSNESFYNVSHIMQKLTPACDDFLKICTLGGDIIDCAEFKMIETVYGYCCTFDDGNFRRRRSSRNRYLGSEMGLTLLLSNSNDDDTISLLNIDGYAVLLHAPGDFADVSSGNAIEVFPTSYDETFLALRARVMDTEPSLRAYTPSQRECYFDDEAPFPSLLRHNRYSLTICITRCRLRSVVALCECVPFNTPIRMRALFKGVPFCTLNSVECLKRYQSKWRNVLTKHEEIEGLEREIEEGLYCPQCLPSCDDVRYEISMMSLPTDRFSLPEGIDASDFTYNITSMSVLRVFFAEPTSIFYKRMVQNTWTEGLSTVGNVVSVCMGFSLVVVFEILFFIMQYLLVLITKGTCESGNSSSKGKLKSHLDTPKLYICP